MFFSLNIVVWEMLCFPLLARHNLPEVTQTGKAEWNIPVCFQNSCAGVLEMFFEQINGSVLGKLFPFFIYF